MRFLITDESPAGRKMIGQFMKPFGSCDLAFDEHEGFGAFRMAMERGQPYDLVCFDIAEPESDGPRVLDSLREMERQRGISGADGAGVIMVTTSGESQQLGQAVEQARVGFVTKPLEEDAFLGQVESLLGELPPRAESSEGETPVRAPSGYSDQQAADRYLIVDDDRLCRELLLDILGDYGECDFAYDGAEAIDAVRLALEDGAPYDLICLDIMMPGVSGHDALQAIRAVEAEHGRRGSDTTKVIMTTALRDSKHCIQSFREGCESYITKPITEEELLAQMRQLGLLAPGEPIQQPT